MRSRTRIAGPLAAIAVLAAGCGSPDDWSAPHPAPAPIGALGPGFVTGPPTPEATVTPSPGSWDGVGPSRGYRVVLLTAGDDQPTRTLAAAVTDWARQEGVSVKTVEAKDPGRFPESISEAMRLTPDLIITAGKDLVDALALVTANHLDRQFLVLGAELAEPTANVTAANWPGASFRGEGLGTSTGYDPASFTPARAAAAVRAGVASVLSGLTGIVIRLG
ncbi:hypothetical protein [Amycolatopsis sp. CA-126428]|uniref:hypothetical protein n=1 Tax=Amycolatopsis sp. CA-126428 TaxID=2073158 RepID=UPI001E55F38F|nr:hypothetical protein [Amycolatopsis sp. CA-126428]